MAQFIIIEDFQSDQHLEWRIVNDGVMGGISNSTMEVTPKGHGRFSGEVSLANNGGFASTRALLPMEIVPTVSKVILRIKGDGKRYSFRIRTNDYFDGVSFRQFFTTTEGEWQEVALSLKDFVPTWRGRILKDIPSIQPTNIRQIGFLIADKQVGSFCLFVDWIRVE